MVSAVAPSPHPPPGPQAPPLQRSEQQQQALAVNALRLKSIADRMRAHLLGFAFRISSDFAFLVYAFARGIDFALSSGDVPTVAREIPDVLRQIYVLREDPTILPSILVLVISCKNACFKDWFQPTDAADILRMTNEVFGKYCTSHDQAADESTVVGTILNVIPRYYPHMKFERLITSMEAKAGYNALMSDFFIERNLPRDEKIRLFVVQKENLEASSCITSPPHVSFLVNGKGVDKRTNVAMDTAPQFPTDITKMLKFGANMIQGVGFFNANYVIAIAFTKNSTPLGAPTLDDYAEPVTVSPADSDVLEGPSKVSLNCPISFRRIKTPIKGRLCKHYQCFDYDNYMDMNLRKPTWRCPYCNTPSNFLDLRIDQKMAKILQETGDEVIDVLLQVDGSWKIAPDQADKSDRHTSDAILRRTGGRLDTDTSSSQVIDLINGDDDGELPTDWTSASEDMKALLKNQDLSVADYPLDLPTSAPGHAEDLNLWNGNNRGSSAALASGQNSLLPSISGFSSSSFGTLESILPQNVLRPVITDAISPSLETSTAAIGMQRVSNAAQLQQLGPIHVSEARRPPIPRNPRREPVGVQALPVPQQNPAGLSRRLQPNTFNCPPPVPLFTPTSSIYQAHHVSGPDNVIIPRNNGAGSLLRTPSAAPVIHQQQTTQDIHNTSSHHLSSRVVGLPVPHYMDPQRLAVPGQAGVANAYRPGSILDQLMLQNRMLNQSAPLAALGQNSAAAQIRPAQADIQSHIMFSAQQSQALRSQALTWAPTQQVVGRAPPHLQPPGVRTTVALSTPQVGISDGVPELPVDENWRPTGRMRGSLTGSAYSNAIDRYINQHGPQQNQIPPPNMSDARRPQ